MSEWNPIDTAPKDGEHILATDGENITTIYWHAYARHKNLDRGCWRLVESGSGIWDDEYDSATHWMKLPKLPGAN